MNITELGGPPLAPMGYTGGKKVLLTELEFRLLQAIARRLRDELELAQGEHST